MKVSIKTHKAILKTGVLISAVLGAVSIFGILGGIDLQDQFRPLLPLGAALGLFNAVLCVRGLLD